MLHGRDHLDRQYSRCNRRGQCTFGFPFQLCDSTTVTSEGRVLYRRRTEDDRWVVPYMPALLTLLDCHVNVDVCFTVNIFMYLYKYLFKGPDRTKFAVSQRAASEENAQVNEDVNEIEDYIEGRYLSASEACWRILEFDTTRKSPGVVSLSVHLPSTNFPQMMQGNGEQSEGSKLLRYFARPRLQEFEGLRILEYYRLYRFLPYVPGEELRENEWLEEPQRGFPLQRVVRRSPRSSTVTRLHAVPP